MADDAPPDGPSPAEEAENVAAEEQPAADTTAEADATTEEPAAAEEEPAVEEPAADVAEEEEPAATTTEEQEAAAAPAADTAAADAAEDAEEEGDGEAANDEHVPMLDLACPDELGIPEDAPPGEGTEMTAIVAKSDNVQETALGGEDATEKRPARPTRPSRANTEVHGRKVIDRLRESTQERLPESLMMNGEEIVPEINAGWSPDPKMQYLSWELMEFEIMQRRPTWFDEDGIVIERNCSETVCFDMGTHAACTEPVETKCGTIPAQTCVRDNDNLNAYGLGINLYFKYLKFMWYMFIWMTIFSIPAILFYNQGVDMDAAEQQLHRQTHGLMGILYYGTAGSWGNPQIICLSGSEFDNIVVECEKGKKITNIAAYYGEPTGTCTCPAVRKPNAQGECPDTKKYDYPYGPGKMKLQAFGMNSAESCCSKDYVGSKTLNRPDLSDVEIEDSPVCKSDVAMYISHGMCLGKESCTLKVNGTWDASWRGDVPCSPVEAEANKYTCDTNFMQLGNFSGCSNKCRSTDDGWVCDSYDDMEMKVLAMCHGTTIPSLSDISKIDAATYIAYFDAFAMLFLFSMFAWLDQSQQDEEEEQDGTMVSADDYTVCILGLPKKTDQGENVYDHEKLKKDIKDHFRRVLNAQPPVQPDNANHDCHVVDVNFVLPSQGDLLYRKKQLGIVARKLNKLNTQHALAKLFKAKEHTIKVYEKKMALHEKIFKHRYIEVGKALKRMDDDCFARRAFVTFDSEEAYVRCRRAYPNLGKLLSLGQPSELRLHGYEDFTHQFGVKHHAGCCHCGEGYRLHVVPAPQSSDLLWGNLGLSSGNRQCRSCCTCLIMLVVLAISFCVIGVSKLTAEQFQAKYPTFDTCTTMNAHFHHKEFNHTWHEGSSTVLTTYDVVIDYHYDDYNKTEGNTGKLGCMCGKMMNAKIADYKDAGLSQTDAYSRAWKYVSNYHFKKVYVAGGLDQEHPYGFHHSTCVDDKWKKIKTSTGAKKYEDEHDCLRQESKLCQAYLWGQLYIQALKIENVVAVAGVNVMLELLIDATTRFERHDSFSGELTSKTFKLFIATLFNTGLMTIVINANLDYFKKSAGQTARMASRLSALLSLDITEDFEVSILNGMYEDFGSDWYLAVGVAILLQIIINVISHPVTDMTMWTLDSFARIRDRGWKWRDPGKAGPHITKQATQDDLIDKYVGAEFKLEKRYAKQLTIIFLVLLFSGGMPYLYVAGMCYFAFILLVDKVLFVKWYRKPMAYGGALATVVAKLLPYAVFGHVSLSMWMYTDNTVFPVDSDSISLAAGESYSNTSSVNVVNDIASAALGDLTDSPFARILGVGSTRWWRMSLPLFFVWLIVLLYILFKDFLIPFFSEFKWFLVPFGYKVDATENWEGNPDYFDSIPLETLEAAVMKGHIYDPEILEIYKEKLDFRKTERKSQIEMRKSMDLMDEAPTTTEPKAEEEDDEKEVDEETGLAEDEERDDVNERSSIVQGRMMLPGVLETYNPLANTAYEVFFAEDVVQQLVEEYGMPSLEEAGDLKLKDLDDVPNPTGPDDEETGEPGEI